MKKFLLPVVFFLLAGCVTEKPLVTTPPAPAGFSHYTDTLQVDFSLARVSDNTVIYEPDANVKKASYETYIFPLNQFRAIIGPETEMSNLKKLTIRIRVNNIRRSTYRLSDNGTFAAAQPEGGFSQSNYYCDILGVLE